MQFFVDLWSNGPLKCAALSWCVAQFLKVLITLWLDKRLDWRRIFGMGGMPSSHSAFVFSLMMAIAFQEGVGSTAFALAFALAAVVIYDAMGVRRETGRQGAVLNQILTQMLVEGKPITEKQLKELVGHSPLEVLGGLLVGSIITLVLML
ncbi:MAG: divergent PAP2 family protein [Clostridia bacterium]|nr:divergent PAP2 family protein [Clostridia bacterium]